MNISNYTFNSVGITVPDKENLLCFAVSDDTPTQRLPIPAQSRKGNSQRTDLPLGSPKCLQFGHSLYCQISYLIPKYLHTYGELGPILQIFYFLPWLGSLLQSIASTRSEEVPDMIPFYFNSISPPPIL